MSIRTRRRNRVQDESDDDCICVDVTAPVAPVVDLTNFPLGDVTNSQVVDLTTTPRRDRLLGANDTTVVVIGSPDQSPGSRRRRVPPPVMIEDEETDSDEELPPCPFYVPPRQTKSRGVSTNPASSGPLSPDPISCPVCLDDYKTIKLNKRKLFTTHCGHVFCEECILSSIRQHRCCPLCRKKLTQKNVFPLHI